MTARPAVLIVLFVGIGSIGLMNPQHRDALFPPCPFRVLTGWYCPLCGGLRMTHDLLHGHLAAAAMDNAFILIGAPLLAGWILLRHHRRPDASPVAPAVLIFAGAIAWTLLRNLSSFPLVPAAITG